jgi:hypothetical protein
MQEGGQTAASSYHCNPGLQVQSAHPCEPLPPSPLLLLLRVMTPSIMFFAMLQFFSLKSVFINHTHLALVMAIPEL